MELSREEIEHGVVRRRPLITHDQKEWIDVEQAMAIFEVSSRATAIDRMRKLGYEEKEIDQAGKLFWLCDKNRVYNAFKEFQNNLKASKDASKAFDLIENNKTSTGMLIYDVVRDINDFQEAIHVMRLGYERAIEIMNCNNENKISVLESSIEKLNYKIINDAPKVELYDRFLSAKNVMSMDIVAKTLDFGRNKLLKMLREDKIFQNNNVAYQSYIDKGYFKVIIQPIKRENIIFNIPTTYVTSEGLKFLFEKYKYIQSSKKLEKNKITKKSMW